VVASRFLGRGIVIMMFAVTLRCERKRASKGDGLGRAGHPSRRTRVPHRASHFGLDPLGAQLGMMVSSRRL
jgi:hypothetical protein